MLARPAMQAGDTVKVHVRVKEGDKERVQVFEGIVINLRRGGTRASFTVRKVSFGQGVERIFPLHSPVVQKIEVIRSAKVRQAKLYYPAGPEGQGGAHARGQEGHEGVAAAREGTWPGRAPAAPSRTPTGGSASA